MILDDDIHQTWSLPNLSCISISFFFYYLVVVLALPIILSPPQGTMEFCLPWQPPVSDVTIV